jgi:acyl-[acyl carrier protein]--UDP-N-acetylglucosamine O-acyltransferase
MLPLWKAQELEKIVIYFLVLYPPFQDLKFGGEDSLAIIGDNCTIRECVTINRGTIASGQTTLGNNCLVMATAHIAHDCHIGDNVIVNGCLGTHVTVGICCDWWIGSAPVYPHWRPCYDFAVR